jgi:molybdate transport system substrate-binding protein
MMTVIACKLHIKIAHLLLVSGLFFFTVSLASAGRKEIRVAVATNFIRTADELSDHFAKESDIAVIRSSGATGMLYSQMVNGAPYDLFLAADEERPELLHQQGLCEEPFTYASGRVVMWSGRKDLSDAENWQQVIVRSDISRIAMANPETAPYGEAAMQAIKKAGLKQELRKHLVYGQNVGQSFQYGQQGAADLAFVAQSFALSEHGRKGKTWLLPEALPVKQKGCMLKDSTNKEMVLDFIAYLQSDKPRKILSEYGYE